MPASAPSMSGDRPGSRSSGPPLSLTDANAEARDIRVVANLFHGSDVPFAFVGAVDSLVAHNTVIAPGRWIIRILQETTTSGGYAFAACSSNRFLNNLVWFDRSRISTFVNIGPNTAPDTFGFANNLWYAFNDPSRSQPSLPAPETGALIGRDPLFKDIAAGVFSLATNSPARAAGLVLPRVIRDLEGRCYGTPPSLGALEVLTAGGAQADADGDSMPDTWETLHGLDPGEPQDASQDPDGDGLSSLGEYFAGTDPRDSNSSFRLGAPRLSSGAIASI